MDNTIKDIVEIPSEAESEENIDDLEDKYRF